MLPLGDSSRARPRPPTSRPSASRQPDARVSGVGFIFSADFDSTGASSTLVCITGPSGDSCSRGGGNLFVVVWWSSVADFLRSSTARVESTRRPASPTAVTAASPTLFAAAECFLLLLLNGGGVQRGADRGWRRSASGREIGAASIRECVWMGREILFPAEM
uniref:Uncharacterized protein n=1 Tax=Oryza punctata TaxID=4537 RepID=A0A0E0L7T9_ORYPU